MSFDAPGARRLTRYSGVGAICVLLNFVIMAVATDMLGWHYMASTVASFTVLAPLSFVLHRRWVFQSRAASVLRQFGRYLTALLAGFLVNALLMIALVEGLHLHYLVATAGVVGLNFLGNYVLQAWWVFARRHEEAA